LEQLATYIGRLETLLGTDVVETHPKPPSTTIATHATLVARCHRENKQRGSRKHVTRRPIDWKLVDSISEPMHARFDFTLEGSVDDEGLDSHGGLPHGSPSDSILESDLSGERELAEHMGRHFESCRRIGPTSTMVVLVLPKWAKFNELTRHWKFY
jgi:hypothetical protein